jgi:hypothetical protein
MSGKRHVHLTAPEVNALRGRPASEVQAYVALRIHRNRETGEAFPGRRTLADYCGTSTRAVTDRIHRLEAAGLIVCKRERGRATRYSFPHSSSEADCTTQAPSSEVDFTTSSEADCTGVVKSSAPSSEVDCTLTALNRISNSSRPRCFSDKDAEKIAAAFESKFHTRDGLEAVFAALADTCPADCLGLHVCGVKQALDTINRTRKATRVGLHLREDRR